jgi:hypothetical protein
VGDLYIKSGKLELPAFLAGFNGHYFVYLFFALFEVTNDPINSENALKNLNITDKS